MKRRDFVKVVGKIKVGGCAGNQRKNFRLTPMPKGRIVKWRKFDKIS